MKNTLSDLNNYLFEQLERLQDDSLDESGLDKEIQRSEAVQKVAKTIMITDNLRFKRKSTLTNMDRVIKWSFLCLGLQVNE